MNVHSIGLSGGPTTAVGNGNSEIKEIDRQIKDLQQKIQEVQFNDELDEQQKQELLTLYNEQIALLQTQKAELSTERNQQLLESVQQGTEPLQADAPELGVKPVAEDAVGAETDSGEPSGSEVAAQAARSGGSGRRETGQYLDEEA